MLLPAGMLLGVIPPIATVLHLAVFAIAIRHLRRLHPSKTCAGSPYSVSHSAGVL
jgi:hypothetical protein